VECWTPTDERPLILTDQIEWRPAGEAPPLWIDLTEFFRDTLDE
jgi:hypothetical protein